jgi:hypothetical protein
MCSKKKKVQVLWNKVPWGYLGEESDQAPAASLVLQVVPNLHVAVPLARAGRDSVLGADRVSSRAEEKAEHGDHPIVRLGCS